MKFTKTTFAVLLISGLIINPVFAASHNETGRVDMGDHRITFDRTNDSTYNNGRTAPEGTQFILESKVGGKTNGRQG